MYLTVQLHLSSKIRVYLISKECLYRKTKKPKTSVQLSTTHIYSSVHVFVYNSGLGVYTARHQYMFHLVKRCNYKWTKSCTCEWTQDIPVNEHKMHLWTNTKCTLEWSQNASMNEHRDAPMNDLIKCTNKWTQGCTYEWSQSAPMNEYKNASLNEHKNAPVNEHKYVILNEHKNAPLHEHKMNLCMNTKWIYEWTQKCIHEWAQRCIYQWTEIYIYVWAQRGRYEWTQTQLLLKSNDRPSLLVKTTVNLITIL